MALFKGFVGPTYELQSLNTECERVINWYPELVESGNGKGPYSFCPTPGISEFCDVGEFSTGTRGFAQVNQRAFSVTGNTLYELFYDGTFINRGDMIPYSNPVTIVSNGLQLLVIAPPDGFLYDLGTNAWLPMTGFPGSNGAAYQDGYFLTIEPMTQRVFVSDLLNGGTWNALDYASAEGSPDNILQIISDHREIWLFGEQSIEVWYNSGAADYPFQRQAGGFIEHGIAARNSLVQADNTLFWIGRTNRGGYIFWKAQGYSPLRVSTHAIENMLRGFQRVDDAITFAYNENGHEFVVTSFPTDKRTLAYDVATNMWHERGYWNPSDAAYETVRGWTHLFAFGKHLVGDWQNGKIYEQSVGIYSDNGDIIRRMRRYPVISFENHYTAYPRLEIDMQVGIGADGAPISQGGATPDEDWDPKMMLRWSNDGGYTWGNELWRSIGKLGEFNQRVYWQRLGIGRKRVFEHTIAARVGPLAMAAAYLDADPGAG